MRPGGGNVGSSRSADERNPLPISSARDGSRYMTSNSGSFPSGRQTVGGGGASWRASEQSFSSSGAPSSSRSHSFRENYSTSSSGEESSRRYSSNVVSSSNQHVLSALGRTTPKVPGGVKKQILILLQVTIDGVTVVLTSPTPPLEALHVTSLDLQECRQEVLLNSVFQI